MSFFRRGGTLYGSRRPGRSLTGLEKEDGKFSVRPKRPTRRDGTPSSQAIPRRGGPSSCVSTGDDGGVFLSVQEWTPAVRPGVSEGPESEDGPPPPLANRDRWV